MDTIIGFLIVVGGFLIVVGILGVCFSPVWVGILRDRRRRRTNEAFHRYKRKELCKLHELQDEFAAHLRRKEAEKETADFQEFMKSRQHQSYTPF